MRALWIKPAEQVVELVDFEGGADGIRKLIGGWLELGKLWPRTGDTLYVDEEGKLKGLRFGFTLPGVVDDVFVGNAAVVGREIGEGDETMDPVITVEQLLSQIAWVRS